MHRISHPTFSEPCIIGTFAFYIKGRRSPHSHGDDNAHLTRPSFLNARVLSATEISAACAAILPPTTPPPPAAVAVELPPSTTPRTPYQYHILLVEDNLINQKVLSKQLRNTGCTVHVANHGLEALDFLSTTTLWNNDNDNNDGVANNDDDGAPGAKRRTELSLILMDLEMPIMDGLTCTRRIRELERDGRLKLKGGRVPIIAVTANARMEQMDLAIEAGMVCTTCIVANDDDAAAAYPLAWMHAQMR